MLVKHCNEFVLIGELKICAFVFAFYIDVMNALLKQFSECRHNLILGPLAVTTGYCVLVCVAVILTTNTPFHQRTSLPVYVCPLQNTCRQHYTNLVTHYKILDFSYFDLKSSLGVGVYELYTLHFQM